MDDDGKDPDRPEQDDILGKAPKGLGLPVARVFALRADVCLEAPAVVPPAAARAFPPYLTTTVRPAKRLM